MVCQRGAWLLRILVTGASGQIGSYCIDEIRRLGHTAIGLDKRPHAEFTQIISDVKDVKATELADIDAVIHCAAQISVQTAVEDPVFDANENVLGTVNMMKKASDAGVKRFVNVSSAAAYGTPISCPVSESHPLQPLSPYGASKASAEAYANMFGRMHWMKVLVVRPFNVYSVRQEPSNPYAGVISKFVDRCRGGEPPVIFGTGEQTRDFVAAEDVPAMVKMAVADVPVGTYNLCTGRSISIVDLARLVMDLFGVEGNPLHKDSLPGEIMESCGDNSLASSVGVEFPTSLRDGLKAFTRL